VRLRRREPAYGAARAKRAVFATTAERAARQGVLWGIVFGGTIAASASSYATAFPTAASRRAIVQTFAGNAAWSALFGPLEHLDTVAGYTNYKSQMTVMILGAIWGLLVGTRLLRGEEDSGRWELMLAGATTRARAARDAILGLGVGILAVWVPTTLLTVGAGASEKVGIPSGAAAFFATAAVSSALMFAAIGVLLGEVCGTRHDANVIGGALIGGSYLVRMVADSDPGLGWLRWASPFGWIEEARGLIGTRPLAFVPVVALVAACVTAAIALAGRRDLGASRFGSRDSARARTALLGSQAGLSLRLSRATVIAWLLALTVTGFVLGLVAQAAGSALRGSATLERVISRLGATGAGARAYLGYVFLVAAGLVAVAVAGQVSATRNEEASGHLDNLLVLPVARWRWLSTRLVLAAALVVAAGAFAGIATWIGAVTQGAAVTFAESIRAGLNVTPPALFVLGIGGLAFGLWPRAAIGVTYGIVVWSFLVETIAAVFDSSHWLRDTSPFLHMAPVPAAPVAWGAAAWLVGLALAAAIVGIVVFERRDLVGA
jgi:ABC-2 type transport system permease protein